MEVDKEVYTFPESISLNMNVIVWLGFDLIYKTLLPSRLGL